MVDTGNSYEGLCEYVGGKYISYTEEHPITMNPFRIQREELNVEKMELAKFKHTVMKCMAASIVCI